MVGRVFVFDYMQHRIGNLVEIVQRHAREHSQPLGPHMLTFVLGELDGCLVVQLLIFHQSGLERLFAQGVDTLAQRPVDIPEGVTGFIFNHHPDHIRIVWVGLFPQKTE